MHSIEVRYYYNDNGNLLIGDIWSMCIDGLSFSKRRNAVGEITLKISIRAAAQWCKENDFDIKRMFRPIRSTIRVVIDGVEVVGGWLSSTPSYTFDQSPDSIVSLTFTDWIGKLEGLMIIPYQTYNDNFDKVAKKMMEDRVSPTSGAWMVTWDNTSDTLPVVQGTIDSFKSYKDFILERTDNTTGTREFDVYADATGKLGVWRRYGLDLSDIAIITYPDSGQPLAAKSINLGSWNSYFHNYYITGAGQGYGEGGTAFYALGQNLNAYFNNGFWEGAGNESSIVIEQTLEQKANDYVKNSDKPYSYPIITIDCDNINLWAHKDGGNLWIGDSVGVAVSGWVGEVLLMDLERKFRIDAIDATISPVNHIEAKLSMGVDVYDTQ